MVMVVLSGGSHVSGAWSLVMALVMSLDMGQMSQMASDFV